MLSVAKPARQFGMLFKFKHYIIHLEIDSLYGQKHRKICICMTKCRAGFATARYQLTSGIRFLGIGWELSYKCPRIFCWGIRSNRILF